MGYWIIVILLLLLTSALISGSEVAFFSLTPSDHKNLQSKTNKSKKFVNKLLNRPDRLLATILIVNNFVNIGIVIISALIYRDIEMFNNNTILRFIFQVILVTFLLLVFGEVVPKVYASRFSLQFVLFMVYPIYILQKLFSPLGSMLAKITLLYNDKFLLSKQNVSMNEISDALEITSPVLSDDDKILQGIVKFGNIDVKDIMKPRVDVTAVDIKSGFQELMDFVTNSGYSRLPVFSGSFDNIQGILYLKDLLPHFQKNNFRWQSLIRSPYFVPETKKINDLLGEFQNRTIHFAVVVDEYGGTSGIVTLEDILEEIVGEIQEETDKDQDLFTRLDDNTYMFNGKVLLNDLVKIVQLEDKVFDEVQGESETLAGLILEIKGEIPEQGEILTYSKFEFNIVSVDNRRIKKIKLTIKQ